MTFASQLGYRHTEALASTGNHVRNELKITAHPGMMTFPCTPEAARCRIGRRTSAEKPKVADTLPYASASSAGQLLYPSTCMPATTESRLFLVSVIALATTGIAFSIRGEPCRRAPAPGFSTRSTRPMLGCDDRPDPRRRIPRVCHHHRHRQPAARLSWHGTSPGRLLDVPGGWARSVSFSPTNSPTSFSAYWVLWVSMLVSRNRPWSGGNGHQLPAGRDALSR